MQAVFTAPSGSQAFLLQFLIEIVVIPGRRKGPGAPAVACEAHVKGTPETTGITGVCLSGHEPRASHLYATPLPVLSPIITR